MLDDPFPVQVSGDRSAGMMRGRDLAADPGGAENSSLLVEGVKRSWHLEAYSWGGLTGRAVSRALWLLVLPFALCNMAGWMVSGRSTDTARGRWLLSVHCGAARVSALALTCLYVAFACAITVDVVAYQCAPRSDCRAAGWYVIGSEQLIGHPGRRVVIGAAAPVVLLVALVAMTRRSRQRYELWQGSHGDGGSPPSAAGPGAEDDAAVRGGLTLETFWDGRAFSPRLAEAHIAGGVTVVAAVVASTVAGASRAHVLGAGLLILASLIFAACVLVATSVALAARMRVGAVLTPATVVLLASLGAAWWAPPQAGWGRPHPGLLQIFNVLLGTLFVAALVILVAGITERRGRRDEGTRIEQIRRWLSPFAVLVCATLLLVAVLAGTQLSFGKYLGTTQPSNSATSAGADIVYPAPFGAFARVTLLLAPLAVFLGLVALLMVYRQPGWRAALVRAEEGWASVEPCDRPWRSALEDTWWRRRARWALLQPAASLLALEWMVNVGALLVAVATLSYSGYWLIGALGTLSTVALLGGLALGATMAMVPGSARRLAAVPPIVGAVLAWNLLDGDPSTQRYLDERGWWLPPVGISVAVLAFLPVVAALVLRRSLSQTGTRRVVAIAWDIATFWPRAFHPLAPPSYGERAVPELRRRLELYAAHGGAVVVAAHSQGCMLATAALVGQRAPRVPLSLITYGSPVRRLYARFFPAYVNDQLIDALKARLRDAGAPHGLAWRNYFRDTDLVGHRVQHADEPETVDVWLLDPATPWYRVGDELPRIRGHAHKGYRSQTDFDAHVVAEVNRLAQSQAERRHGAFDRSPPPYDADETISDGHDTLNTVSPVPPARCRARDTSASTSAGTRR